MLIRRGTIFQSYGISIHLPVLDRAVSDLRANYVVADEALRAAEIKIYRTVTTYLERSQHLQISKEMRKRKERPPYLPKQSYNDKAKLKRDRKIAAAAANAAATAVAPTDEMEWEDEIMEDEGVEVDENESGSVMVQMTELTNALPEKGSTQEERKAKTPISASVLDLPNRTR